MTRSAARYAACLLHGHALITNDGVRLPCACLTTAKEDRSNSTAYTREDLIRYIASRCTGDTKSSLIRQGRKLSACGALATPNTVHVDAAKQ